METHKRYYRIDRRAISLLRFLLEAYDGIAGLTTIDPKTGLVVLCIAPGCEADVDTLLEDLQKDVMIQPVNSQPITNIIPGAARRPPSACL